MSDPFITKAASRLRVGRDLSAVSEHWKSEQLGLVLSADPKDGATVYNALMRYHAAREFVDFVEQLAKEAD